jgi:hypothetical protein
MTEAPKFRKATFMYCRYMNVAFLKLGGGRQ